MEVQIVMLIVAILITFLPFGRVSNARPEQSISTTSSVMSAILNKAQTVGFQSGDCTL
jgi:hypothetical protein